MPDSIEDISSPSCSSFPASWWVFLVFGISFCWEARCRGRLNLGKPSPKLSRGLLLPAVLLHFAFCNVEEAEGTLIIHSEKIKLKGDLIRFCKPSEGYRPEQSDQWTPGSMISVQQRGVGVDMRKPFPAVEA